MIKQTSLSTDDYINPWFYQEQEVTSEMLTPYIGFVYIITDLETNQLYVGKKFIWSHRKVKNKTRRQKFESDWRKYYSSHDGIKKAAKENPMRFKREILYLCKSEGETNFLEIREQFKRDVLYSEQYLCDNINRQMV